MAKALIKQFPNQIIDYKTKKTIKAFRRRWKFLSSFIKAGDPKHYMSFVLFRLGNIFVDIAYFGESVKSKNNGYKYIFVAIEAGSQITWTKPLHSRNMTSLYTAIKTMSQVSPYEKIHTIWSDRESTFLSRDFQRLLKQSFGIRFQFLTTRHKAFFAERHIRYLKERLSMLMGFNDTPVWSQDMLQTVTQNYNRGRAHHTSFRRLDVTAANWPAFLREFYNVPSSRHVYALTTVNASDLGLSLTPQIRRSIWKFPRGTGVLLKRSGYAETKERKQVKSSIEGNVGSLVFYIFSHHLKANNQLALIPVYRLARDPPHQKPRLKTGFYYER